MSVKEKPN